MGRVEEEEGGVGRRGGRQNVEEEEEEEEEEPLRVIQGTHCNLPRPRITQSQNVCLLFCIRKPPRTPQGPG